MNTGIIIQARMGSTRLRGKVMNILSDNTVLGHVVNRLQQTYCKENVIIATTDEECDDEIYNFALSNNIKVFRGSQNDVLSRYYHCAVKYGLDGIVRVTSDCPVIDPLIINKMLEIYLDEKYELVTNVAINPSDRTFPRGIDAEIFSFDILKNAFKNAYKEYHREHVTPYLYENSKSIYFYKNDKDLSKYRWTLDTQEDMDLINEIYRYLYKGVHNFYMQDIVDLMVIHPELVNLNSHIEQKKLQKD
jgi:spore coat polysaccharide biosynthesis protein SpsF